MSLGTWKVKPHLFERSTIVGSDRCKQCGEVSTFHIHAMAMSTRDKETAQRMYEQMHTLQHDQINMIKGVALIMLCEKIATDNGVSADAVLRAWLGLAVQELKKEGSLE